MISEIGALVSTKGGVLSTKRCTCQQQSSAAACTGQQQSSAAACTGQQHRDTNTAAATTKRQHVQPHVHTETQIQQQLRRRDNTCRRRYNMCVFVCVGGDAAKVEHKIIRWSDGWVGNILAITACSCHNRNTALDQQRLSYRILLHAIYTVYSEQDEHNCPAKTRIVVDTQINCRYT